MADVPYVTNIFNITQGVSQAEVDAIHAKLDQLIAQGAIIVTDLTAIDTAADDIQAKVTAEQTVSASAQTLLTEIAGLLRANANDPAAVAAIADKLDASSSELDTSTNALAAAVAASSDVVPAEPPAEPTP